MAQIQGMGRKLISNTTGSQSRVGKMTVKSCNTCQFCFFIDYGYSNYTVEGTYFVCGGGHHPAGSFDRFYGEDARLQFGRQCEFHADGTPVEIDVDRDNLAEQKMTPAQIIMWRVKVANTGEPQEESSVLAEQIQAAWRQRLKLKGEGPWT